MSWQFHVGQRVVCINDDWGYIRYGDLELPLRVPMLNEVLTIVDMNWRMSGIDGRPSHTDSEGLFLSFSEIPQRQTNGGFSSCIAWASRQFRPLDERKTDISIFTRMLDGAPSREDAHV